MPQFKPFKGIRPAKDFAGFFATKSVDAYNDEELEKELEINPDSFLHIVSPIWDKTVADNESKHKLIAENFHNFIESDNSNTDKASFYIYQMTKPNKERVRGIIGLVHIDDYENGSIKRHEETMTKRTELFAEYLQNVN